MGYTATWAGYATGIMGIFAVVCAPSVGKLTEKVDTRLIVSLGIIGLGATGAWRLSFNSDVTFLQMAWPTLIMGPLMVLFFVPLAGLANANVDHAEAAKQRKSGGQG